MSDSQLQYYKGAVIGTVYTTSTFVCFFFSLLSGCLLVWNIRFEQVLTQFQRWLYFLKKVMRDQKAVQIYKVRKVHKHEHGI